MAGKLNQPPRGHCRGNASGIAPTFRLSLTAHIFQPQSCRKGYWTHSHECLTFTYRSLRGLVMKFLYRVYPLLAVLSVLEHTVPPCFTTTRKTVRHLDATPKTHHLKVLRVAFLHTTNIRLFFKLHLPQHFIASQSYIFIISPDFMTSN